MNSTAQKLRKTLTDAEQKLWRHIRKQQLMGFKFRRQSPIGKYVVDFVCLEKRLVVELDGGQHAATQVYNHSRSEWLRSQGFKVIRFWNHDVMNRVEEVKEVIARNLIQHSAGSGKTNSISWLSHRLASLHNDQDQKIFDCVIVVTDRQVLDRQLQDAIYQIEHAQGVVKAIDQDSRQLAEALIDGTKIVVTTLQKFPFVLRGLLHAAGVDNLDAPTEDERFQARAWEAEIAKRRYAVIADEAHSSQSGETAKELKAILGANAGPENPDEEPDWEDRLNQVMQSRGPQPNLSFFAYTATPKGKTLELFGRKGTSGKPEAFHLYSMRQAIEEGYILDVVKNYTTYRTYFKLVKAIEDDPTLPKKKAARALAKFLVMHPTNIEQKIEVIVEHFRGRVRHHLAGRAKAMVVTASRLQAVRYYEAFCRYIKHHGYDDVRPLVAFSGTVKDPDTGLEYTEPGMNLDVINGRPIGEKQLPERFASPDYQILLVANKYQTGFDQPLLMAMYVDKRLDGVQAVQALSRLNRMVPGKETPFVLDFVNNAEDIYKAFKPYYDATSLQETSDPSQLNKLKHELDTMQVYHWNEVEAFARVFYRAPGSKPLLTMRTCNATSSRQWTDLNCSMMMNCAQRFGISWEAMCASMPF